jgi:hypothetical protein
MDNIFKILNFLPIEIIFMIIPYTYEPQGKSLTNDIKNFYSTKATASKLYYERFVIEVGEPEPGDKDWFVNDLICRANQAVPTQYGYVDNFYNLFLRNVCLKTREEVLVYIQKTETREVSTQINIYWGLFSSEERNSFLKLHYLVKK